MKQGLFPGLIVIAACLLLPATPGLGADYTVTSGFDYSTGKYGDSTATDIFYVPVIGTYENKDWTAKVTVPWLRINGPGTVTPDLGPVAQSQGKTTTQTQSGLGDIILAGTYDFYLDPHSGLTLSGTAKVKLGTASRTKGLGTGENDYFFQLDAALPVGDFTPFATLGYRFVGNPPGYNLNNVFYGSLGSAYKLDLHNSCGASLDLREKISDGGSSTAELTVFYTHKFDPAWRLQVYTVVGFTKASPDFGLGSLASLRF